MCNLVYFHGRKYGQDKEEFFRSADLFVFPTYYHNECFPLVLLEAMEHGVPCISTREGGIAGIIDDGKTGWITERRNPEILAEKIEWMLLHREESMLMGKAGHAKFVEEFTLTKFEEHMAEILSACVVDIP